MRERKQEIGLYLLLIQHLLLQFLHQLALLVNLIILSINKQTTKSVADSMSHSPNKNTQPVTLYLNSIFEGNLQIHKKKMYYYQLHIIFTQSIAFILCINIYC